MSPDANFLTAISLEALAEMKEGLKYYIFANRAF